MPEIPTTPRLSLELQVSGPLGVWVLGASGVAVKRFEFVDSRLVSGVRL